MRNPISKIQLLGILLAGMLLLPSASFAETAAAPDSVFSRIERLKQLREEDPEAYQQIIQRKRNRVKKHTRQMREQGDGQAYQQFKDRDGLKKRQRLKYMKENNPERFDRFMENRVNRMKQFKEKNPEQFQKFVKKHPRYQQKFQGLQQRFQKKQQRNVEKNGVQKKIDGKSPFQESRFQNRKGQRTQQAPGQPRQNRKRDEIPGKRQWH